MIKELDYLDQINIAMLAPSRAGKSTLIAAMAQEFNNKLRYNRSDARLSAESQDNIYAYANSVLNRETHASVSTSNYLNVIKRGYVGALNVRGTKFEASRTGNRESVVLSFNISNDRANMPFRILDYPGGAVSAENAEADDASLETHARILSGYSKDCFAVVVPVFAMAIMELSDLDKKAAEGNINDGDYEAKRSRLEQVLCIDDIRQRVVGWCLDRAEEHRHGLLIITPVKCEKYMDDVNKIDRLRRMTLQYVFEPILAELKAQIAATAKPEEIRSCIEKYVKVTYLSVQTFGQVFKNEKCKIEWPTDLNDYQVTFSDIYVKNGVGARPTPVGAAGLLHVILKARNALLADEWGHLANTLQANLNDQNWFTRFCRNISGRNQNTRNQIQQLKENIVFANELVRQIATLNFGVGRNLVEWDWFLDEDEECSDEYNVNDIVEELEMED